MKSYHRLDEIQNDLYLGNTTCSELVEHYLKNIEDKQSLNAFVEVYKEEALERAVQIDEKIKTKRAGKLAGLVFGIKDLLCYQNHQVSGGSKILEGFESQFTATAVQRLLNEDAIVIGRQNCDEFGMGSSNENSAFGHVKNAADESRVPGGSSGGSAVAVQADMCLVSLGTDTGGSVRQPASFCGIVGIKPTYSRVSRWGLLAYASSFDTIGVFAKSVADCELVLQTIGGHDPNDATSSREPIKPVLETKGKYKVAYLKEALSSEGVQEEVKDTLKSTLAQLQSDGHTVEAIEFPLLKHALPTYYILTTAESSTNLSRYDGAHYGHRSAQSEDLESMYKNSRTEGFGDEVRRRIMLGTFVLSADYHDAYFKKAQEVRRLIKDATEKILSEYDFIVIPTSPTTAFPIGANDQNPLQMYMADLFTVQASVSGIPAISIPMGKDQNSLPIGIQVMTKAFEEDKIFAFSKYLMKEAQLDS